MIPGREVLIAMLVLAGCAANPNDPGQWRHETRTPDDFRRDYEDCAEIVAKSPARQGAGAVAAMVERSQTLRRCLEEGVGWEYVGRNSP
jgi:hypothetical protein